MSGYHVVRGERWHLVLAPRAAGRALYLARADALRRYAPVALDQVEDLDDAGGAGEDVEPGTLRATWTDAGDAHVFRAVRDQDLATLAYYSTAAQLVYTGPTLGAPPARYVAVAAEASREVAR